MPAPIGISDPVLMNILSDSFLLIVRSPVCLLERCDAAPSGSWNFFFSPVQLMPKESWCLAHTPKFMLAVPSNTPKGYLYNLRACHRYAFIYQGTFETPQM